MKSLTKDQKGLLARLRAAEKSPSGTIACYPHEWRVARALDCKGLLDHLSEPDESGNFAVRLRPDGAKDKSAGQASETENRETLNTPKRTTYAQWLQESRKQAAADRISRASALSQQVLDRIGANLCVASDLEARPPRKGASARIEPMDSEADPIFEMHTDSQRLIAALKSRAPVVLLHGRAGTGKTTLVRSLAGEGIRHVIVAPTGVAALNAGGQTINSFFGIPPWITNIEDIKPRDKLRSILQQIDVIVIDEISMVRADVMDRIDATLKVNLNRDEPFGGKRLLLVGDFLQMPPVVQQKDADILRQLGYRYTHAFGAKCLSARERVKVIELTRVYRQSDPEFLNLLHHVRSGSNLADTLNVLNRRCHRPHPGPSAPVILTARKDDAQDHNLRGLNQLPGDPIRFTGKITGNFRIAEDRLPAPEELDLKVGARIIMVKNDLKNRAWVNGSLGTVTEAFKGGLWVRLDGHSEDDEVEVLRETWESIEYGIDPETKRVEPVVVGSYTQYPIAPAWAMTIHKAQGLTLEDVRIDLGGGAFSSGQTYVALSRATSLDGLSFSRPLRPSDVRTDTRLVDELKRIVEASQAEDPA